MLADPERISDRRADERGDAVDPPLEVVRDTHHRAVREALSDREQVAVHGDVVASDQILGVLTIEVGGEDPPAVVVVASPHDPAGMRRLHVLVGGAAQDDQA